MGRLPELLICMAGVGLMGYGIWLAWPPLLWIFTGVAAVSLSYVLYQTE